MEFTRDQDQESTRVISEKFEANDLNPGGTYSFRVAAINTVGSGPYTQMFFVNTPEISRFEHFKF